MARIYGCGVVNVAAYLVSVCEMHFMNLLWLLMWRHLHIATHTLTHTLTNGECEGAGATWRWLYAALASHNQRQRVASPEFGLTGVVIKRGAGRNRAGQVRAFTFTAYSWMRNLLTRQQRISSWPNPCRAWLSLSAAHEIFSAREKTPSRQAGRQALGQLHEATKLLLHFDLCSPQGCHAHSLVCGAASALLDSLLSSNEWCPSMCMQVENNEPIDCRDCQPSKIAIAVRACSI